MSDVLSAHMDREEKLIDRLHEGDISRSHFDRLNEESYAPVEAEMDRLATEVARLRAALVRIAEHPHCGYPDASQPLFGQGVSEHHYKIGIADGHRCAAAIAREALGEQKEPTEEEVEAVAFALYDASQTPTSGSIGQRTGTSWKERWLAPARAAIKLGARPPR